MPPGCPEPPVVPLWAVGVVEENFPSARLKVYCRKCSEDAGHTYAYEPDGPSHQTGPPWISWLPRLQDCTIFVSEVAPRVAKCPMLAPFTRYSLPALPPVKSKDVPGISRTPPEPR